jgi:hypothetical protein
MDHGTSKWEPSLVDIAWAMNRSYVECIGCTPWELVFRNKMCPLHELDVNERKEILGVPCEEGGVLDRSITTGEAPRGTHRRSYRSIYHFE